MEHDGRVGGKDGYYTYPSIELREVILGAIYKSCKARDGNKYRSKTPFLGSRTSFVRRWSSEES
jgi:hypothetical protein